MSHQTIDPNVLAKFPLATWAERDCVTTNRSRGNRSGSRARLRQQGERVESSRDTVI
jgi:hypothetical protein